MHWLQNAFSSFSSSPSKSSIDFHRKENGRSLNLFRKRRAPRSHPRLTRQRKFRHLSDVDVGRLPLSNPSSPPSRPCSLPVSQYPRSIDYQSNCTSSAVPQPLPLPELPSNFRPESLLSPLSSRNRPISSAKVVPSRGEGEGTDYLIGERTGEEIEVPPSHITESRFAPQTNQSSRGHDLRAYKSPADHVRMMPRDSNAAVNTQNIDSALTSDFSSPALSPRRFSAGDVLSSLYTLSQRIQAWPSPDLTSLDMLAGFSHQTSLDRTIYSPDLSPQYSPKTSGLNSRNPSGSTTPMHYKFNPESTHVPVYQLPRPPGTPVSSQSSFSHQNTTKSEVVSMLSQWQKGKLIGRGTFGSVYVATNTETGAYCAMKEVDLIPDDTKSAECIKQLKQEINVLSQLKHQNIVQFYGSEIVGNHFYIYLEYVHPGSLNKYVHEHCKAVTENVVRNFTRHILHGLDYLHSTKTVHRDIKGANLLVDASGVVKLADFGLAKHFTGKVADLSLKGSPHWMAPELIHAVMQKDNNSDLAFAVDIWSLGCTIIEMLTGKPPWSEVEGAAAMFKVLRESPPIPETLSSEGKDFLKCCFRRNPAERPSASKLLEHCFVRNSHHGGATTALTHAFSGIKLMDIAHSPREQNRYKSDSILSSTSNTQTIKGKQPFKSETGQQSHTETCNSLEASRHSPNSTLETLPCLLSPPNSSRSTSSSHSPNVLRSPPQPGSKNGHFNAHLRTRGSGKEFPFLF